MRIIAYSAGLIRELLQADERLLRYLNLSSGSILIAPFAALSDITSVMAYGLPLGLIAVGLVGRRRKFLQRGLWSFFIVLTADYTALLIKILVRRPRAYETFSDIILSTDGGNSSFPSGHTVQAFAMAIGVAMLFRHRLTGWLLISWASLVGVSRVCLGAHYPGDVIGGALLSWGVAAAAMALRRRFAMIEKR